MCFRPEADVAIQTLHGVIVRYNDVHSDDITWTEADGFPLAGTYIGPQAVVVDRLVADGDTVIADGKYTWNHKESGEPCEARMAHVWTLSEGKAIAFLQLVDTAMVRELINAN